ncbi:hypothetical protein L211DRAFT_236793 [Terfezia boudieri ATCC MYA-4762]|uniref:Uncharacterized protein n=1 Tax=Terfezia boudieri ATCC MYA-4762 TaxID=1051890 RepID=A0A3N4MKE7_9PEZI|nr:hypothetical protein L211DRAFT_236793 [Terfezia boudieri ATCC MYA-4762]
MYSYIITILLALLTHVVSLVTPSHPIPVDLIQISVDCQLLAEQNQSPEALSAKIQERVSQYCDDQLVHFPAARGAPQLVYLPQPIQKRVKWADGWVDSDLRSIRHFDLSDVETTTIADSDISEYQFSWEEWNWQW